MDWDKLRVFHAAAEAGSFTHAGEKLNLSQSAVSRQVSALEYDLNIALFHRHARGLVLTEQGEELYHTAHDVLMKLEAVKTRLTDSKERPSGTLRVNTTFGLGSTWLTSRVNKFIELYPDITLQLQLADSEQDLTMREADVAIRLHPPTQPDLIQRKLFTVHFHLYAAPSYIKRFGQPKNIEDLDDHRLVAFGDPTPDHLKEMNWLMEAGTSGKAKRVATLQVNNVYAMKNAVQRGVGIGMLPDYVIDKESNLTQLTEHENVLPAFDCFFVYPEELRSTARVKVFRDFLVGEAQKWSF